MVDGQDLEAAAASGSVHDNIGEAGGAYLESSEKSIAETVDTVLEPELRLHHLGCRKRVEPDATSRLTRRASTTFSMTLSQESVASSPESIWFARRAVSSAQTGSSSGWSAPTGRSSGLSRRSKISSARSASDKASTSDRIALALAVRTPRYNARPARRLCDAKRTAAPSRRHECPVGIPLSDTYRAPDCGEYDRESAAPQ